MPDLKNKFALVTGGASGIGAAISRRFAADGAHVAILDLNASAARDLAAELKSHGQQADAIPCDVADPSAMRDAFAALPSLQILVNCAGIAHVGDVLHTSPEDLDRLYQVNIKGVYHGIHFGLPRLLENPAGGVILNIASVAAKIGISDRFAYSMTKGAVLSMTLSVARDYIDRKIRCNCLCPARIHTPFVDGFLAKNYPGEEAAMFARLSAWQPIGRMGTPAEVAALAAFLCSDEAAFITGSAYDIDGGVTLLR